MSRKSSNPATDGLSERSTALWGEVTSGFKLSAAELEVLRQALSSLDRAEQAAAVLNRDGVTSIDRYGSPKTHPAVDIEARHRALFARLIAQLGIEWKASGRRGRPGAAPASPPPVAPSASGRRERVLGVIDATQ